MLMFLNEENKSKGNISSVLKNIKKSGTEKDFLPLKPKKTKWTKLSDPESLARVFYFKDFEKLMEKNA